MNRNSTSPTVEMGPTNRRPVCKRQRTAGLASAGLASMGLASMGLALAAAVLAVAGPDSAAAQSRSDSDRRSGVASGSSVRAVVRSYETATIGAELNARITHLPEREGNRFKKGEMLVSFDCSRIVTELQAANATLNGHRAVFETQSRLQRYQAAGHLAVEQARFEMEKASAEVAGLEVKRSACTIQAPFDGRVVEKSAQVHEIAQPNQPLLRVINDGKLEVLLMVPSAWLAHIVEGSTFNVRLDETGEVHEARILQSTGLIDPVSQTARLIAELLTSSPRIFPGMSGFAILARTEEIR